MSKKITLLIDNIITPYEVPRYNAINRVLENKLLVWFQAKTDTNRHWKNFPKTTFTHEFLEDRPIRIVGADIHTVHWNPQLWKKLEEVKPELEQIIICGWDSISYWLTVYFCKKYSIPYTLWSGSTSYESSWRRTLFKPIINWVVQGATRYIAYGSRAKEYLTLLGADSSKIAVFYNGVDTQFYLTEAKRLRPKKAALRKSYKIPDGFTFIYVGQLIERKGVSDLLRAFLEMRKIEPKTSLIIVGTGALAASLKSAAKEEPVFFFSHKEFSELPELYASADCLVLPSHEEVWGLVVNEALLSGLPVIASDRVGSTPDLVTSGKSGYTYPAGDTTELQQVMQLVMQNKEQMIPHLLPAVSKTDPEALAKQIFRKHHG